MASAAAGLRPVRAERTDHQLVGAVRRGDDRAFEELYSRYQRRITAYVFGMVKDHGRAEDITQDVFVSALRRMRKTERPIAFKAWIYEIAKNACIDAYRRGRRAEEVSYDADDRLTPSDHVRLIATGPEPDAAVGAKQELDHLCGAFGGLSDSHHEILVLRELEGMSYKDIGERMGMSRPAVESTLFRARRRLSEEYDELASGARCLRVRAIVVEGAAEVGVRDRRKLARHISHCQPCRSLAARACLDVPVPERRRIVHRIGALLPVPFFLRPRRGAGDDAATAVGGGGSWMAQAPSFADAVSSGWGKGAAGIVALVLAGAGVSTVAGSGMRDEHGTGYRERAAQPAAEHRGPTPQREEKTTTAGERGRAGTAKRESDSQRRSDAVRPDGGGDKRAGDSPNTSAGSGGGSGADAPSGGGGGGGPVDAPAVSVPGGAADAPKLPTADAPAETSPTLQQTTDAVSDTASGVNETVQTVAPQLPSVQNPVQTVTDATEPVTEAVGDATGGLPQP